MPVIAYQILVLLVLLRWIERVFAFRRGIRRLTPLDRAKPGADLPTLTIVVPALNEEATAEPAMRSLLALDYPSLQIIAINDRSTDGTGAILDRLAAADGRLRVIHVQELPEGWLGKNHALHVAASQATGEWILFTDADIHFEPSALRRAVAHAVRKGADHLVVMPEVIAMGFCEKVYLGFFWIAFAFRWDPGKVSNPKSRHYIGVGAFNLVRAEAYRNAGGHAAMKMEVLDDVMLGKLMKRSGARQECMPAGGMVRVRWVEGLGGAVRGLTKNMFAGMRFSLPLSIAGTLMLLVGAVLPLGGLFFGPWSARVMCAAVLGCMMLASGSGIQIRRLSPLYGLTFPLGAIFLAYTLWRSIVLAFARGGIEWRGTFYPLEKLRRGAI